MTSANTYTDQSYVVYHITYSGDKLPSKFNSNITPSNYIGSTSLEQINKGYMGSVTSKKYKSIWNLELKENPNLFKLKIISYHDTRSDATYKELQIQKLFNVVKNSLFINMAYASPNGCFDMDKTGENNPMFGSCRCKENNPFYNKKHNKISLEKIKIARSLQIITEESYKKGALKRIGKGNSRALKINIYNTNGILQYTSHGNFIQCCLQNNLPSVELQKSYRQNGTPIYTNKKAYSKYNQFIGWYAIIVST